ncbi:unnamed protein product [Callosobruchus maculatus]|uniref:Uncharacterized protein n=1 Tax=Callosobruchus maculatus TaxID=64391 RepID=A0A653DVK7_CALMS|nr:unnamed protein product [Callosobruchus maculatus]
MVTGQKTQTKFTMKGSLFLLGQNQQDIKDIFNRFKKANVSTQPFVYCNGKDIFSIEDGMGVLNIM